jgi:hypothetical protein
MRGFERRAKRFAQSRRGFSSGHVGKCSEHQGSRRWFEPTRKTFLERVTAGRDSLLDQSEHTPHELNLSFVKIGTWPERTSSMDGVDGTRISHAWARRRVLSRAICPFPERMSHVASTGPKPCLRFFPGSMLTMLSSSEQLL